jgi:hypothetical protein
MPQKNKKRDGSQFQCSVQMPLAAKSDNANGHGKNDHRPAQRRQVEVQFFYPKLP